jgi:[ribosomal protein S5]-alanine N-acetyltransferase
MTPIPSLTTTRLVLTASTVALLDAELESPARLGALLGVEVPDGWPPGEYDRQAIEYFRDRLSESPASGGWYGWYAVLRGTRDSPPTLVGAGGYFGPPDSDGAVEIGYSIAPGFERRGLATELVLALVDRARACGGVRAIVAHTSPSNIGSVKVLERNGFAASGPGREPGTVRFHRDVEQPACPPAEGRRTVRRTP